MPSHAGMVEFMVNNQHGEAMKKIMMTASFILGLSLGLPAHSEDGATLYLTRGCIGCHGVGGNAPVAPNYPKIGMQNKQYTINQLKSFKSASRTNGMAALMTGMAAALTDADIELLADYLSTSAGAK
ncbi:MAG: c-type cytochrome [Gammaproteobacteria bacterium]|nr:c-type cytochrome [Gammaproteobacteria bacterium]